MAVYYLPQKVHCKFPFLQSRRSWWFSTLGEDTKIRPFSLPEAIITTNDTHRMWQSKNREKTLSDSRSSPVFLAPVDSDPSLQGLSLLKLLMLKVLGFSFASLSTISQFLLVDCCESSSSDDIHTYLPDRTWKWLRTGTSTTSPLQQHEWMQMQNAAPERLRF